eukprot:TRINITY_DN25324_c0_g1_i1.p1 TRINITY_DN25324_c0_g1~~TRINITY_DN25324_c0_g1_i1.p1  ORF type:complete len:276 (+),score=32.86 TRINITY_DN25324_c0_g1_i1:38-865(+)
MACSAFRNSITNPEECDVCSLDFSAHSEWWSGRKRIVGVFTGGGLSSCGVQACDSLCVKQTKQTLQEEGYNVIEIPIDDGCLDGLETCCAVHIPGGHDDPAVESLAENGRKEKLLEEMSKGLGVVGICAGAWVLGHQYDLIPVKQDPMYGDTGIVGQILLNATPKGVSVFSATVGNMTHFDESPLMTIDAGYEDDVNVDSTYRTRVFESSQTDEEAERLIGTPVIIRTRYQHPHYSSEDRSPRCHIVAIGPHFELLPSSNEVLARATAWVARGSD